MSTPEPDDQLAAIQKAGKLVVGVEGTYYPFTFHDETTNELTGYDIEVAKAIAAQMGVEVEFVESEWDSLLVALDTGRLDTVINDVTATEERREKYDFSDNYFYSARQVVVKTGNEVGLHSLEDLNGKKIATNATNSWVGRLEELGVEIVPIDNTDQCATMVETGRVDFCMFNTIVLGEYMIQHPEAELEVAFVIEDDINEVAIPARKGEERFLNEINTALQSLRDDGTLLELSMKYFGANYCDDPRVK
nr:transporter substrate-binding domain-containing protein [uncultured Oscillibacter sp.]